MQICTWHGNANLTAESTVTPWISAPDRGKVCSDKCDKCDKCDAVLRVAAKVSNKKSYVAATLDERVERLNVAKPAFYYDVDKKDKIPFELARIWLTMVQNAITDVGASGGSAMDRLAVAAHKYVEVVTMDTHQGRHRTRVARPEHAGSRRGFEGAVLSEDRRLHTCWRARLDRSLLPSRRRIDAQWLGTARQRIALQINGLRPEPNLRTP